MQYPLDTKRITIGEQALITLDEAKAQLRILDSELDSKITATIGAAIEFAERFTGLSLRPSTWMASYAHCRWLKILRRPITAVSKIEIINYDGVATEIETSKYRVDLDAGEIVFVDLPSTDSYLSAPLRVYFSTGYATGMTPEALKQAVLIILSQFFDERNAPDTEAMENVLKLYR